MVQNHLLQLRCRVAMEPPTALNADVVRDEKLKGLRALVPIDERNVERVTVRGQYGAGASAGGALGAYAQELGNGSPTETFVSIKAEIANWRWAGVPFSLRTRKRLAPRVSPLLVALRPIPPHHFHRDATDNKACRESASKK